MSVDFTDFVLNFWLAQLVDHLTCKQAVSGSIHRLATYFSQTDKTYTRK